MHQTLACQRDVDATRNVSDLHSFDRRAFTGANYIYIYYIYTRNSSICSMRSPKGKVFRAITRIEDPRKHITGWLSGRRHRSCERKFKRDEYRPYLPTPMRACTMRNPAPALHLSEEARRAFARTPMSILLQGERSLHLHSHHVGAAFQTGGFQCDIRAQNT